MNRKHYINQEPSGDTPYIEGEIIDVEWTPCQKEPTNRERCYTVGLCLATVALFVLLAVALYLSVTGTGQTESDITTQTTDPTLCLDERVGEVEDEEERIELALLTQGYYSQAVPLEYEYQDYMRTYSELYGCPYALTLAVAESESNFDMSAVGAVGEVGIMQLNPGPEGSYHAELESATGLDPATPAGNIAGGCYLLGKYLAKFDGDLTKTLMAYNMGVTGAERAWESGVTSSEYAELTLSRMRSWAWTVGE